MHAGFSEDLRISITVAPVMGKREATKYAAPLDDFFSEATQKVLLAPFPNHLRGYKRVKTQGHVDKKVANVVRDDMGRDRWSDPDEIFADFLAAKEKGSRLFQERKTKDASPTWQDTAVDIDKMLAPICGQSSSSVAANDSFASSQKSTFLFASTSDKSRSLLCRPAPGPLLLLEFWLKTH